MYVCDEGEFDRMDIGQVGVGKRFPIADGREALFCRMVLSTPKAPAKLIKNVLFKICEFSYQEKGHAGRLPLGIEFLVAQLLS